MASSSCTESCCDSCSKKQVMQLATSSCTQFCCDPCKSKKQVIQMKTSSCKQSCCDPCKSTMQVIPTAASSCMQSCCNPCAKKKVIQVETTQPCHDPCSMIQNEVWDSLCTDSAIMQEVQATHTPDGRKVDVKPILRVIYKIAPAIIADASSCGLSEEEKMASLPGPDFKTQALAYILNKVSCELSSFDNPLVTATMKANCNLKQTISPCEVKMPCNCKSLGGGDTTYLPLTCNRKCSSEGDAHATTMVLLNTLSNYSWDAKVVLTVAAFEMKYGEFFLVAPCYTKNASLSQSMALLNQLREITEHAQSTKPKSDEVLKLFKAIVGVTKWIVDFSNLSLECLAADEPPLSVALAYIPKAAYWTILSVAVCALHIASIKGRQESTTVSWNLSWLAKEGIRIQEILKTQLTICKEYIDGKSMVAYWDIMCIMNICHRDNLKILKTLIFANDCGQYVTDGSNKQICIEEFRGKNVLLLISGLDLSKEEIDTLGKVYLESQKNPEIQYQVVWLPVVDKSISWDQEKQQKFEQLRSLMPWYIVPEPSKVKPEVIKYIKNVWHFTKKMILVPIDPKGSVQSLNALDMLWIWGNSAFPFINEKEESLWETQSWTLELLLGDIDRTILNWTKDGRIVCFYGGEDIEWIRDFTRAAKNVTKSTTACTSLELVYVGKSNATKQVEKIIKTIDAEKLSHCWTDVTSSWFFWTRLESILYLKMQRGKNYKNDNIMREVATLLSYDGGDKGWALFSKGSCEMTLAKGDVALRSLKQFNEWKDAAMENGFLPTLFECLQQSQTLQRCNRIILSGNRWEIPCNILSSEGCECTMEKCFVYRCCVD